MSRKGNVTWLVLRSEGALRPSWIPLVVIACKPPPSFAIPKRRGTSVAPILAIHSFRAVGFAAGSLGNMGKGIVGVYSVPYPGKPSLQTMMRWHSHCVH